MKKFFKEFKEFAMRGNVIDLAVGVVIGGAFGKITTSLVNDIIMPLLGCLISTASLQNLYVALNGEAYPSLEAALEAGAPLLKYGSFLSVVLDFVIIAFCIFLVIKAINRLNKLAESLKKKEEAAPAAPTTKVCPFCKTEIALDATRCPHCTSLLEENKK